MHKTEKILVNINIPLISVQMSAYLYVKLFNKSLLRHAAQVLGNISHKEKFFEPHCLRKQTKMLSIEGLITLPFISFISQTDKKERGASIGGGPLLEEIR